MVALEKEIMTEPISSDIVLPVDAEHFGVRAMGCGAFVVLAVISFLVVSALSNTAFIGGIAAILIGGGGATLLESYLKHNWESGRELMASDTEIMLTNSGINEIEIDPQQTVNVLTWYFTNKRNGRIKKGWHVVALTLEQEDEQIPTYTFVSPDDFEEWEYANLFTKLERPKTDKKAKAKTAINMRQAGEQRRLLDAEMVRSAIGAELTFEAFNQYIHFLQANYSQWMID